MKIQKDANKDQNIHFLLGECAGGGCVFAGVLAAFGDWGFMIIALLFSFVCIAAHSQYAVNQSIRRMKDCKEGEDEC